MNTPPAFDRQSIPQDQCEPNSVADHSPQLRSKPILKHRSISDLLTSALPNYNHTDDDLEDQFELPEDHDDVIHTPLTRPPLLHTKSDTNVTRWSRNRPFRKDSPPRIVASARQTRSPEITSPVLAPILADRSGSSDSARETSSSSQDLNACTSGGKKRHISFNTFVTQCIAIDSPPKSRGSLPGESLCQDAYDDGSVSCCLTNNRLIFSFIPVATVTRRTLRTDSMTMSLTRADYFLKGIMGLTQMKRLMKYLKCAPHWAARGLHLRRVPQVLQGTLTSPNHRFRTLAPLPSSARDLPIRNM